MNKTILAVGILLGTTAIIFGAFGAHGLENLLEASQLDTFETGVKYQMYHALFLLLLGQLKIITTKFQKLVFLLTVIGVVFFSFSIYFLATNSLTAFDFRVIGFVTPIGGLCLILAWMLLGYGILRTKAQH